MNRVPRKQLIAKYWAVGRPRNGLILVCQGGKWFHIYRDDTPVYKETRSSAAAAEAHLKSVQEQ